MNSTPAPAYRLLTLGCKLNQADSSALEARLLSLGLRRAGVAGGTAGAANARGAAGAERDGRSADVVILNTCTVTGSADREARQIARRLRREHPRATLVVTGCYAERDGAALASIPGIDHVVGMRDQAARVAAIVADALGLERPEGEAGLGSFGETGACGPFSGDRTRAQLKIQDGCDLRCAYCIIPAVRGASRSLPPDEAVRRIGLLTAAGYREIIFTGVNTGDYGLDLSPALRLHHLLMRALQVPGLGRLRLNSLEPRTVTPEIGALLVERGGTLARHLQIPLQSGCDAVLARMRRNYRVADYARVVEGLRAAVPDIGLGADVIAGFPGETDAEFETTCRFIEGSPLNYLHVFSYSPRPGTNAALAPGAVPAPVIRERSARLRAIGRTLSLRFRLSMIGRELEVLVLREPRADGRLRALTDNFIDLGLDAGSAVTDRPFNRLLRARLTAATPDDTLASVA